MFCCWVLLLKTSVAMNPHSDTTPENTAASFTEISDPEDDPMADSNPESIMDGLRALWDDSITLRNLTKHNPVNYWKREFSYEFSYKQEWKHQTYLHHAARVVQQGLSLHRSSEFGFRSFWDFFSLETTSLETFILQKTWQDLQGQTLLTQRPITTTNFAGHCRCCGKELGKRNFENIKFYRGELEMTRAKDSEKKLGEQEYMKIGGQWTKKRSGEIWEFVIFTWTKVYVGVEDVRLCEKCGGFQKLMYFDKCKMDSNTSDYKVKSWERSEKRQIWKFLDVNTLLPGKWEHELSFQDWALRRKGNGLHNDIFEELKRLSNIDSDDSDEDKDSLTDLARTISTIVQNGAAYEPGITPQNGPGFRVANSQTQLSSGECYAMLGADGASAFWDGAMMFRSDCSKKEKILKAVKIFYHAVTHTYGLIGKHCAEAEALETVGTMYAGFLSCVVACQKGKVLYQTEKRLKYCRKGVVWVNKNSEALKKLRHDPAVIGTTLGLIKKRMIRKRGFTIATMTAAALGATSAVLSVIPGANFAAPAFALAGISVAGASGVTRIASAIKKKGFVGMFQQLGQASDMRQNLRDKCFEILKNTALKDCSEQCNNECKKCQQNNLNLSLRIRLTCALSSVYLVEKEKTDAKKKRSFHVGMDENTEMLYGGTKGINSADFILVCVALLVDDKVHRWEAYKAGYIAAGYSEKTLEELDKNTNLEGLYKNLIADSLQQKLLDKIATKLHS